MSEQHPSSSKPSPSLHKDALTARFIELFDTFFEKIGQNSLAAHRQHFRDQITGVIGKCNPADLQRFLHALSSLPTITGDRSDFSKGVSIAASEHLDPDQKATIVQTLRAFIPWRKGPFEVFDTHIDTEWRSDWKWDRVQPHLSPLRDKNVLDVGCGSGYHCWRMHGEGARWVLGIDPSARFVTQFEAIKHFVHKTPVDVIPLGIEHLPKNLGFFDTVFSMGVLYHRTSPIDHLKELRDTLKPGGELVLETLVIEEQVIEEEVIEEEVIEEKVIEKEIIEDTANRHAQQVLVPEDRYAMMRNVWFIPSVAALSGWISRCGFEQVRCVDINQTSLEEQRSTEWMPSHSLKEFLDPNNPDLTVEGYPAPKRAVMIAKRKGAAG